MVNYQYPSLAATYLWPNMKHNLRTLLYTFGVVAGVFYSLHAAGQKPSIKGTVKSSGTGVAAVLTLRTGSDSSWVKSAFTDDSGAFSFDEIATGKYLLNASAPGYRQATESVDLSVAGVQKVAFDLVKDATTLSEVTVSSKKPFIEMSLGKTTVNIEGAAGVGGSNALDILRRLPGVSVVGNNSISIHGKQGVLVLIDDRPTYLSGDELADYLKSMQASEIAQLELITQPGAKYDAAGNTGIINIKTKKGRKMGWNGNASLTPGQGVYTNVAGSVMLNYRKDKLNLALNCSDREATGFADWNQDQFFTDNLTGAIISTNKIHSTPKERWGVGTVKLAADYNLTEKTTIGSSLQGTYHPNSMTDHVFSTRTDNIANAVTYSDVLSPDGFIRKDASVNAYLTHKYTSDRVLDVNLDGLWYGNFAHQDVVSNNYDGTMQLQPNPLLLHSRQPSVIKVASLKVDYTFGLKGGIKGEAGLKSSFVQTDNNSVFSIFKDNSWINDTSRSNRFVYKENINAAYISLSKKLGTQWETKLGLRAEQTLANGQQEVHNQSFDRSYVALFPTIFVGYKLNDDHQFELNGGRRIDRPGYRQLNPFIDFSFQYSYKKGNPALLPEFTNSFEFKHSYKNVLFTSIAASSTTDVVNDVLITDNATHSIYSTYMNMARNENLSISSVFNKQVSKRWTLNLTGVLFYSRYGGFVNNIERHREGTGSFFSISSQFDFGKGWKADGFLNYNGEQVNSIIGTDLPSVYLQLGASKKIRDNINVSLSLQDPFHFFFQSTKFDVGDFHAKTGFWFASQQFAVTFSYSFGKKPGSQHEAESVEEKKRIR